MEDIVKGTLLFDFYGELLTAHQQKIYEAVVCNDMGYSEVAEEEGISRQSVHDLVRRCQKQLDSYEASLHLVEKFLHIQDYARQIQCEAKAAAENGRRADNALLVSLSDRILKEL